MSLRRYFITGLVILLPAVLTILFMLFLSELITSPFVDGTNKFLTRLHIFDDGFLFLSGEQLIRFISQAIVLVVLVVTTILIGVIARWFFFDSLIQLGEYLLRHTPLVNRVYKTVKDVTDTLFQTQHNAFREVVIVPFPQSGIYSLGFITRAAPKVVCELTGHNLHAVFVPTTPNPTSGFLMMLKEEDITRTSIAVEDAVKFIISCGVIHPDALNDNHR